MSTFVCISPFPGSPAEPVKSLALAERLERLGREWP